MRDIHSSLSFPLPASPRRFSTTVSPKYRGPSYSLRTLRTTHTPPSPLSVRVQYAPSDRNTTRTVRIKITKSYHNDQLRMYQRSSAMR